MASPAYDKADLDILAPRNSDDYPWVLDSDVSDVSLANILPPLLIAVAVIALLLHCVVAQ